MVVYGEASPVLSAWCRDHAVPLHGFDYRSERKAVGLARNALYLLRPDTYVAVADPAADPATLERYFADRQIKPLSAPAAA